MLSTITLYQSSSFFPCAWGPLPRALVPKCTKLKSTQWSPDHAVASPCLSYTLSVRPAAARRPCMRVCGYFFSRRRNRILYFTGGSAQNTLVWRTGWSALMLEAGGSPTEVPHADGSCPWHLRRRFTSTLRRRAVAGPPTLPLLETGADMVLHYQGVRVRPALDTCAAAPSHAVNVLTDEQQYSRRPGAAAVLLCGRATPLCEVVWHSLRALICRPQLALSQPGSLQVLLVCVVGCMGCAGQVQKKECGFREDTPFSALGAVAKAPGPPGKSLPTTLITLKRRDNVSLNRMVSYCSVGMCVRSCESRRGLCESVG